jgi:hypothetical protein
MNAKVHLKIIQESPARRRRRGILDHPGDGSVTFNGFDASAPDICCGNCQAPLAIGLPRFHLSDVVIRCHACGACNDATTLAPKWLRAER